MNIRRTATLAALTAELLVTGVSSKCGSETTPPPSTSKTTTPTEKVNNCAGTRVGSIALVDVAKKQFKVTSLFTPAGCEAQDFAPVYKYDLAFTAGSRESDGQKIFNEETFTATCISEETGIVGVNAGIDKGVIVPETVVIAAVKNSGVPLQTCSPSMVK